MAEQLQYFLIQIKTGDNMSNKNYPNEKLPIQAKLRELTGGRKS
jgi:hypothetical protein